MVAAKRQRREKPAKIKEDLRIGVRTSGKTNALLAQGEEKKHKKRSQN